MTTPPNKELVSLDLGCGNHPRNLFGANKLYGVDVSANDQVGGFEIRKADLAVEKIPYDNDFFDIVTAFDFIEHVPRVLYIPHRHNSFIELMNEISRVLKPGGAFFSSTPAYPSPAAFQDPTHVNVISHVTWREYFSVRHKNRAVMYGYNGKLYLEEQRWMRDSHIVATMRKESPEGSLNVSSLAQQPFDMSPFFKK